MATTYSKCTRCWCVEFHSRIFPICSCCGWCVAFCSYSTEHDQARWEPANILCSCERTIGWPNETLLPGGYHFHFRTSCSLLDYLVPFISQFRISQAGNSYAVHLQRMKNSDAVLGPPYRWKCGRWRKDRRLEDTRLMTVITRSSWWCMSFRTE